MKLVRTILTVLMGATAMLGGAQEQALMWAEQLPVFPGGSEALARALAETIIYPPSCNNTQGKVVVQFVVTETGDIGEVKVVRSIDQMLDSIAIAAVKGLPKFIPGRQDGQPVDVWLTLPINFKTQNTTETARNDAPRLQKPTGIQIVRETSEGTEYLDSLGVHHVERSPRYPGGDKALMEFLAKQVKYPNKARRNNIQGIVVVQFVVTKTGDVGEIKVVRSVDPDLDAEAKRVCGILPKFEPATLDGEPINVWYTLPINFRLKENPVDRETEELYRNGLRYLFGLEATPVDYSIARDYLKRAAMRGHPQAKALIRQYNF